MEKTLKSVIALLQVVISMFSNPSYRGDLAYRQQTDSLAIQAMSIAQDSFSSYKENINVSTNSLSINKDSSQQSQPQQPVQVIKDCILNIKDDSDSNRSTKEVSWTSTNISQKTHGTLYGAIGHRGDEWIYSKFRDTQSVNGIFPKLNDSPVYKLVFDDGTACSTQ